MPEDRWVVRDVPVQTRRLVKMYAAENGITMGEAIERMVDIAIQVDPSFMLSRELRDRGYRLEFKPRQPPEDEKKDEGEGGS